MYLFEYKLPPHFRLKLVHKMGGRIIGGLQGFIQDFFLGGGGGGGKIFGGGSGAAKPKGQRGGGGGGGGPPKKNVKF